MAAGSRKKVCHPSDLLMSPVASMEVDQSSPFAFLLFSFVPRRFPCLLLIFGLELQIDCNDWHSSIQPYDCFGILKSTVLIKPALKTRQMTPITRLPFTQGIRAFSEEQVRRTCRYQYGSFFCRVMVNYSFLFQGYFTIIFSPTISYRKLYQRC